MNCVDIFGINFAVTDYQGATDLIIEKALAKQAFSVYALPVHGVIERRRDLEFGDATDAADLIVPDGQPIKWAMNYFYETRLADRVYGPKLVGFVLAEADRLNLRVYLYGGSTEQVLSGFSDYISSNYPGVVVCGAYREPEFGKETLDLGVLREAMPHLVLVGLGCPVQEKWIARNKHQVDAVMMGVGAAFSFYSGDTKQAPEWMQDNGLEWLFRLLSEPRRLWRRYATTNLHFIYLIGRKLLNNAFKRRA